MKKNKGKPLKKFWEFLIWLIALLVALAVGFGMTSGTLSIRWIPTIVTIIAGWFVVILTLMGVIMTIYEKLK